MKLSIKDRIKKQRSKESSVPARRPGEVRKKKLPKYRTFRLNKPIRGKKYKPLPSSWALWKVALSTVWRHKKTIGIFLVVYGILYFIFVRGLSDGIDLGALKTQVKETLGISLTGTISSITLFGVLLTTSNGTTNETAAIYQIILLGVGSLAFIWLLRQLTAQGTPMKVRVRDGFYRGMQPMIPFMLVCLVLLLELVPMMAASYIFNTVQSNSLLTSGVELFSVGIVVVMLTILSLYLLSGSIAALYIVTLPGAEPINSIRASHELLRMHRWSVIRKLLILAFFILASAALIFIPLLLLLPSGLEWIAQYTFFACSILTFAVAHSYLYTLYRSLL